MDNIHSLYAQIHLENVDLNNKHLKQDTDYLLPAKYQVSQNAWMITIKLWNELAHEFDEHSVLFLMY